MGFWKVQSILGQLKKWVIYIINVTLLQNFVEENPEIGSKDSRILEESLKKLSSMKFVD